MLKKKTFSLFCKTLTLTLCGIVISLIFSNNSYSCPGIYGDCNVAYRCDETYSLETHWCYPSDATLECDDSSGTSECRCVCPEGGCTECGISNDGISSNFDCDVPMVVLDKILSAGQLEGKVYTHYEEPKYISSCGKNNYKYNFFRMEIPFFKVTSSPPYFKEYTIVFPEGKKDGYTKSSSFKLRRDESEYQAQRVGVNNYYAVVPDIGSEEYDDEFYTRLKILFSERIKADPWNIGEFDNHYFNQYNALTNLGSDHTRWRNIKLCEKYNDPNQDDTDYDNDHRKLVDDVLIAVAAISGSAIFTGPLLLHAAPLVVVGLVEAGAITKQESIDPDRKCYNSPLIYNRLWGNYKTFLETGVFPECNDSDIDGYCKTSSDVAKSGLSIPISSPTPFYANTFYTYQGGSFRMNSAPIASYEPNSEFEFFNPQIDISFTSGGESTSTSLIANQTYTHTHDEVYAYQLRFQTERPDNFLAKPQLCLYSCRASNDNPAYCSEKTKSLHEMIVNESDEESKLQNKARYLVPYSNTKPCLDFPDLDYAEGHEIKITSIFTNSDGEENSFEDPAISLKIYNDGVETLSYEIPLYENSTTADCGIISEAISESEDLTLTQKRKRMNRECQLATVFHNELDYVNYPTISFNGSDYMKFFLFYNHDLINYDEDDRRYLAYVAGKEDINNSESDTLINSYIDYFDTGTDTSTDNTPQKYCESYYLKSDINSVDCSKYDGNNIICDYNSCSGGTEDTLKTSSEFSNLMCIHGLIRNNNKTYSGTVNYYQNDSDGNSFIANTLNATTEFAIHPYDINDTTGLITNDYYIYAESIGITVNNNLCVPMPAPEPEITFTWTNEDPSDPQGTISFTNPVLGTVNNIYIDNLSGSSTQEQDFRYDFFQRYYIKAQNDNGVFYLDIYRYDKPEDSTYDSTVIFNHEESLNTCAENSSLITGAYFSERDATVANQTVQYQCEEVNGITKTVEATCDRYGNWTTDGNPENDSCTVLCVDLHEEEYVLSEYVNTTGVDQEVNDQGSCQEGYRLKSGETNPVEATCTASGGWTNIVHNCEKIQCTLSGWEATDRSINYYKLNYMNVGRNANCTGDDEAYDYTTNAKISYYFADPLILDQYESIERNCNESRLRNRNNDGMIDTANSNKFSSNVLYDGTLTYTCDAEGNIVSDNNCKARCYNHRKENWWDNDYRITGRENSPATSDCYSNIEKKFHCKVTCQGNGRWVLHAKEDKGC